MPSTSTLASRSPESDLRATHSSRRSTGTILILGGALIVWLLWTYSNSPAPARIEAHIQSLTNQGGRLYLAGASTPYSGWVLETNLLGALMSRSMVADGLLDGPSEGFHANGRRQVLEHFRQGVSHGIRVKWHANGVKASETHIVNGQIQGWYRAWHENGSLSQEVRMTNNQPYGIARSFHPDGSLKVETTVHEGTTAPHVLNADSDPNPR